MPRRCDLTGKGVSYGHNVSHSNRKTQRRFEPNLQKVSLPSEALGRSVSLRVSTAALKSVEHRGGLDAFLLSTADERLPAPALRLKRQVRRARSSSRSAPAS